MLKIDKISKRFDDFHLNLSFNVKKGEYFVLLGSSGVGKSVLLEIIAGIIKPDSGKIELNGKNITGLSIQKRGIGLVFQKPALFPHLDVKSNIAYGMKAHKFSTKKIEKKIKQLATEMGIYKLLKRKPGSLSGGEAQRVALARMVAISPDLLLLDEPISSLDRELKDEMKFLLRKLNRMGQTILHVTHDYEEAISLASTIAIIGKDQQNISVVEQIGKPQEVFSNPKTEFTARFIGMKNIHKGKLTADEDGVTLFHPTKTSEIVINIALSSKISRPQDGFILFSDKDVIVSLEKLTSSARNCFKGVLVDFAPSERGVELTIDVGIKIFAIITPSTFKEMKLVVGQILFASFKASSLKFLSDE
jgi:molybdate/tungstate transport system ATP-binding protein